MAAHFDVGDGLSGDDVERLTREIEAGLRRALQASATSSSSRERAAASSDAPVPSAP